MPPCCHASTTLQIQVHPASPVTLNAWPPAPGFTPCKQAACSHSHSELALQRGFTHIAVVRFGAALVHVRAADGIDPLVPRTAHTGIRPSRVVARCVRLPYINLSIVISASQERSKHPPSTASANVEICVHIPEFRLKYVDAPTSQLCVFVSHSSISVQVVLLNPFSKFAM